MRRTSRSISARWARASARSSTRAAAARRARHPARRRLCAERPLSRRHASARHHRDHAGLRTATSRRRLVFVAARGHHADIGGIAPGSMPPDSRTIDEEGVLIDNVLLVDEGRFREAEMRALLASRRLAGAQPGPQHRRSEGPGRRLRARRRRAAAGRRANTARDVVDAYMGHVHGQCRGGGAAADRHGSTTARSPMRWTMAPIVRVAITVDRDARVARPSISPAPATSCPTISTRPIRSVRAAALYVFRTLVDDADPDERRLPAADHARSCPKARCSTRAIPAAVVAGNVETSQVVTDALFAALGALAPSQGTMNNFTFGNDAPPILRDDRRRRRGRARTSTARARCRPT